MALLTKAQIVAAQDLKTEKVPVPEWGGECLVRAMTARERDDYEAGFVVQKGGEVKRLELANVRARLVALTLIDEKGVRLFNDLEVFELGRKSAAALTRVYEVAKRLSGISQADEAEMTGNSASVPSGDSPTV